MLTRLLGMDDLTANAADILAADLYQEFRHKADCMPVMRRLADCLPEVRRYLEGAALADLEDEDPRMRRFGAWLQRVVGWAEQLYQVRMSTRRLLYRASLKGGLPVPEAWKCVRSV